MTAALAGGTALRLSHIGAVGFNSDEAVYAGQAAALAGNPLYTHMFPVFRAHPLLFQSLLAPFFRHGTVDVAGRVVAVTLGMVTVLLCYLVAARLFGRRTAVIAACILALMPYHVVVSRQVLLDGPAALLATLTLLLFVRYLESRQIKWMVATGAIFGLALLAKETNVLFLGAMYATLALLPNFRRVVPAAIGATVAAVLVFSIYPLALALGGHEKTGRNYLVWQLSRQANHSFWFYEEQLPWALGPLVLVVAVGGLYLLRRRLGWRELTLVSWILVPLAALQIWPVKGYQYLLPVAPAIAILAASMLDRVPDLLRQLAPSRRSMLRVAAVVAVLLSIGIPSLNRVQAGASNTFLAGSGGLPGGRAAGQWLGAHVPKGAVLLTIGPTMANVLEYYGHRDAYALSISPNPLHRNPSYTAVPNPDLALRDVDIQYVVWDAYSAARSHHFSTRLLALARRYHGRVVHTEYAGSGSSRTAVIVIYEVRP
ncbi:MAG TPA: glycosyltransferase family 39 protein [Mycobacteriales bacterium]|nr:glycosyltransferase family 39 protein [Mycobacteriales bacterium]